MPGQGTCFDEPHPEDKKKDSVYHQVKEFLDKGETLAVATIVSAKGSTPREVGAKMVVTAWGEILGTIGGGCGEADVKREAIEVIRTRKPRTVRVDIHPIALPTYGTAWTTRHARGPFTRMVQASGDAFASPLVRNAIAPSRSVMS